MRQTSTNKDKTIIWIWVTIGPVVGPALRGIYPVAHIGAERYQCGNTVDLLFFRSSGGCWGGDGVRAVEAQIFMGRCCAESCTVGNVAMVVIGFLFRGWLV